MGRLPRRVERRDFQRAQQPVPRGTAQQKRPQGQHREEADGILADLHQILSEQIRPGRQPHQPQADIAIRIAAQQRAGLKGAGHQAEKHQSVQRVGIRGR